MVHHEVKIAVKLLAFVVFVDSQLLKAPFLCLFYKLPPFKNIISVCLNLVTIDYGGFDF